MPLQFCLLGTAAGGGLPQWNCACRICELARHQPGRVLPRTQQAAAFSGDGKQWYLIGASPDLGEQLRRFPPLWPRSGRETPIAGIVLLSADLDGVLGLLHLREFTPLVVYATAAVRRVLEANSFLRMLQRVQGQLCWVDIEPGVAFQLGALAVTPMAMEGSLPFYAQDHALGGGEAAVIGLEICSERANVAYTPGLAGISADVMAMYKRADAVFVDGTFWSDDELGNTHAGTPRARAIGHQPLGGADGTLAALRELTAATRVLVHMNNTNPVLDPESAEHAQAVALGWQVGFDGWNL